MICRQLSQNLLLSFSQGRLMLLVVCGSWWLHPPTPTLCVKTVSSVCPPDSLHHSPAPEKRLGQVTKYRSAASEREPQEESSSFRASEGCGTQTPPAQFTKGVTQPLFTANHVLITKEPMKRFGTNGKLFYNIPSVFLGVLSCKQSSGQVVREKDK